MIDQANRQTDSDVSIEQINSLFPLAVDCLGAPVWYPLEFCGRVAGAPDVGGVRTAAGSMAGTFG